MTRQPASRDTLYAQPLLDIAGFRFDDDVARVFPDMIQRSVPGYSTIIAMTGVLAERYAQAHSRCYDLGCSLGASTLAMRAQLQGRGCDIVAVDNSAAMLTRFQTLLDEQPVQADTQVHLICADMRDIVVENASVVVLNFTLQFIAIEDRLALLQRIYQGMRPGAILILSEKICFDDQHLQALNTDLHHAFKRANGYSEMEISQKRTALEDVLRPETILAHQQRLRSVGFASVDVWFQCFNFMSLVAIRPS